MAPVFLYPLFYAHVPFLAADPRLMAIFLASYARAGGGGGSEGSYETDVLPTIILKLVRVCLLAPALLLLLALSALGIAERPLSDSSSATTKPSSSSSAIKRAPPLPWLRWTS